jgi:hypothetical protein
LKYLPIITASLALLLVSWAFPRWVAVAFGIAGAYFVVQLIL